jgi:hypothetical protein
MRGMKLFALLAVVGLGGALETRAALAQSDVFVTQASGRLPPTASPPLRRAPIATRHGQSIGMYPGGTPRYTCTWVNATSPHCYAATQQGRPLSK